MISRNTGIKKFWKNGTTINAHGEPANPSIHKSIIRALHHSISLLLFLLLGSCLTFGCSRLPVIYDLSRMSYTFLNQDNAEVSFPSAYKGKIVVMSFIYTHCPDICPLTTNNMQHLQDTLSMKGIRNVEFVTLTFDPNRDTPNVLKEYAAIRGINFNDPQRGKWDFLSGPKANTDSVLYSMDVRYFPGDSSYTKDGQLVYYITHVDKSVLIDQRGKVRGTYSGSQLDFGQIIEDIRSLE